MSRVLLIGLDAGGNVPPALAIAAALLRRGHEVELAGYSDPHLPGVAAAPLDQLGHFDVTRVASTATVVARYVHVATSRRLERQVGALIARRRPDAVVVDCMMVSAVQAATRSGVPTTVLFHTFAAFWTGRWARGPVGLASRLRGLAPATVWGRAESRLVVSHRDLDPGAAGAAFDWTGPTEIGSPPVPRPSGEPPLVLVSLSSTWFPGQGDAYRRIVAALGQLPVRAIVTTGGVQLEGRLDAPANVEIRGRAAHEQILPHAALVIGHGGHSTTLKALAHGVPVLVMPMHPLLDQPIVGRAVAEAGVGGLLGKSASVPAIRRAVGELLDDGATAAAAARMGERLRRHDGAEAAANRVTAPLGPTVATDVPVAHGAAVGEVRTERTDRRQSIEPRSDPSVG